MKDSRLKNVTAVLAKVIEVVFGLVALCLSQYFAYGVQLEKDVDGLL